MKKLFTVLAVLLVASVAFAAVIKGDVKAQYTFNFDNKTIVYGAPDVAGLDATLNFDPTELLIVGDAEATHIEAKVTAGVDFQFNAGNNHDANYKPLKGGKGYLWYKQIADGNELPIKYVYAGVRLDVDTFKIVGKDWSVDFINGLDLDFAKSAIDNKTFHKSYTEANTQYYSLDNSVSTAHDLTVTYKDYSVGFGFGTYKDEDREILGTWDDVLDFGLTAVTPEYAFGDFTVKAGAGYQVIDSEWSLAGSAKAAYASEKFAVSAALDAIYDSEEEFANNELAVKLAVAPVSVDLYWNNEGATVTDSYWKYYNGTKGISEISSNYLSAKVVVDVAKVAENVPVKVTFTGKDLVNENKQILNLEAETTIVPNFKFGVYFKDICDQTSQTNNTKDHRKLGAKVEFTGVQNLTLNAEVAYKFAKEDSNKMFQMLVGASYAHELFTASASVAAEKFYDKDVQFAGKASAVSTTLVDGAELSAKAYFNLNKLQILDEDKNNTNKLVLGCKVAF